MKRLLPYPLVSAGLLIFWLLLNLSMSAGQIILGAVIGILGGWALGLLEPPKARVRLTSALVTLPFVVLADIIASNIAVARVILGLGPRRGVPGFVDIPLQLKDPYGLAVLACIITATPGTVWVNFDSAEGILQIHVLDLVDADQWIAKIKSHFEEPLREIFQ